MLLMYYYYYYYYVIYMCVQWISLSVTLSHAQQYFLFRLLMTFQDQVDIYEVDKIGFLHCQVELGIPRLPLLTAAAATAGALNDTRLNVVAVPRDHLRDPGSYYFIGVSSQSGIVYFYTTKNVIDELLVLLLLLLL